MVCSGKVASLPHTTNRLLPETPLTGKRKVTVRTEFVPRRHRTQHGQNGCPDLSFAGKMNSPGVHSRNPGPVEFPRSRDSIQAISLQSLRSPTKMPPLGLEPRTR